MTQDRLNFLDDFEPDSVFVHHWGRTVTESDVVLFSTQMHLYQPAYLNSEYAVHLGLRSSPVPELLVFSIVLGLSVEDLSESGGSFLGANGLEFLAPVSVGDTLYASSVVSARRESRSRPGWGIVEWKTVGSNQDGVPVLRYSRSSMVRRRPGSSDAAGAIAEQSE